MNSDDWDAWEKLKGDLKVRDAALNFERESVLHALGFPIGMGQGAEYWHSSFLLEETARKMKAFMRGNERLKQFLA